MKKRHYFFIFLAIIASPIIVDYILYRNNPISEWLPTVGYPNEWIGFWGSYIGAIISGLIALYVLFNTIAENAKIRETQVKTIKYTQQQTWLENLRRQLIEDYKMFDMQSFSIAIDAINRGAFDDAVSILLSLNRNIEFQAHSSSLYFITENPAAEEAEYNDCVIRIMTEFGTLINDLLFICPILREKASDTPMSQKEIIEKAQQSYEIILKSMRYTPNIYNYYKTHSALSKIVSLEDNEQFVQNFNNIIKNTLFSSIQIHSRKYELIACTEKVLRYEEQRINKILE